MAKRIAAEKVRAELRHAVLKIRPNVMGKTKKRILAPKQANSCWFARHSRFATNGASLCLPGVLLVNTISPFPGLTFFISYTFISFFVFLLF